MSITIYGVDPNKYWKVNNLEQELRIEMDNENMKVAQYERQLKKDCRSSEMTVICMYTKMAAIMYVGVYCKG